MEPYDHKKIEEKWQKEWLDKQTFAAQNSSGKPKWYSLIEFPYPSGDGMHVGHIRSNTAMDIISRKRRMEGFNVLYPIGWDAFGLPTENYAIKTGQSPQLVTKNNTDTFRRQLQAIGFSFDWSREINTTDPTYYKWTQWIFLQMFKAGLAYKAKTYINWCPKDKIGLANEEVINGHCERCGTAVEKREKEQWMLAITKYADRLDRDLDTVDYLPQIKTQQRNWIGRSEGAEIEFQVGPEKIKVFTTRPDTLFGVTFIAISPELAQKWIEMGWPASNEIKEYVQKTLEERQARDFDKNKEQQDKTGIYSGFDAVHPITKENIPVWIVNYVLGDVGTGAIMGVPAHDERDFEFAKKYNLPITYVVIPRMIDHNNPHQHGKEIVFRNAVIAVVRNPKDGKIINLKWKKQPWTTFVMGGVEDGEDIIEAARREIIEETGYKNLKFIRVLGGPVQSEFYAAHKGVNRVAHTAEVLFELENDEREPLSDEEASIHEVIWVNPKEIDPKSLAHIEASLVLDRLEHGEHIFDDTGILINSGEFNGMDSEEAKKKITEAAGGRMVTTFKLRDWVFSRQRYWGEPIPLVYCESCAAKDAGKPNAGWIAVPETDLPVTLPLVEKYTPTDSGESPLANITEWTTTTCPVCGGSARRETDVMPNWAGSSWYYLAYLSRGISNFQFPISKDIQDTWFGSDMSAGPVDWYNGGMEHTTLHLLYSRFWHKFLYDQKLVPTSEPYQKRTSHGLILAEGGEKMSKSKGNVINPDTIVDLYGADTLRLYEMFMGPFDQPVMWNTESIIGVRRFLERVWKLAGKIGEGSPKLEISLHKTIKKVTEDIEAMRFNTAVSVLMIFVNESEKETAISRYVFETFLKLLSPFAPHITSEIWKNIGNETDITFASWPSWDEEKLVSESVVIVVQVNGKVRGQVEVPTDSQESVVMDKVRADESLRKWLSGEPKKVIFVKNRLINIVV